MSMEQITREVEWHIDYHIDDVQLAQRATNWQPLTERIL